MAWNRLWGVAAVAALACGVAWATAEPARGGRAVPDAEAARVFGGATTPQCLRIWKPVECGMGPNCATTMNLYEQNIPQGIAAAMTSTPAYCGMGMNCNVYFRLSGCDFP